MLDLHWGAVSDLLQAFDNDELSRADAAFDNPHRTHSLADIDRPDGHLVVASYHGNLIGSLEFRNGPLWNKQGAVPCFPGGAHSSELARTQNVVGIGKCANHSDAAGCHIHLPIR